MKQLKKILAMAVLATVLTGTSAHAFLCTPTDELGMFVTAMQDMSTSYQTAMLQLSTDVGAMADRIVYTEQLIGQMADRIVATEALMAQLTLMLAQIAANQSIDPALAQAIQDTVTNTCTATTAP